jgi:lysophospholipase L1-like esterase
LVNGFHYNYKGAPEIGMESAYLNLKQPNNNSPEWDFSEASPNLLVINLGTNDNNLKVDTTLFKQTYTQFIRNLRFIHQNAVIMVLIPFNQVYKNQIEELVTKETERDKNLNFISTEGWLTASDFVDGTHPTDLGHQKISDKLTPIIKSYCK